MRYLYSGIFSSLLLLFPCTAFLVDAQESSKQDAVKYVSPFARENELCFTCHSVRKYVYTDESEGKTYKGVMNADGILVRDKFYSSNHRSFSCTDCHSSRFHIFPHPDELKGEQHFQCLDCHGGDPAYAVFNFETIDAEFRRSVHSRLEEKGFDCWKCHEAHSSRLSFRQSENLKEVVAYSNGICLDCHADYERFKLFSDRKKTSLKKVHKWLPHMKEHFSSVRCIDCHTRSNEKILVAHYVMPANAALRDCRKCHTENPEALTSLPAIKGNNEMRDNDIMMSSMGIIGPNRNNALNNFMMTIFTALVAVVCIHLLFRRIIK